MELIFGDFQNLTSSEKPCVRPLKKLPDKVYIFKVFYESKKYFKGTLFSLKIWYLNKQGQQASLKIWKHPDEVITRWRSYTIWRYRVNLSKYLFTFIYHEKKRKKHFVVALNMIVFNGIGIVSDFTESSGSHEKYMFESPNFFSQMCFPKFQYCIRCTVPNRIRTDKKIKDLDMGHDRTG